MKVAARVSVLVGVAVWVLVTVAVKVAVPVPVPVGDADSGGVLEKVTVAVTIFSRVGLGEGVWLKVGIGVGVKLAVWEGVTLGDSVDRTAPISCGVAVAIRPPAASVPTRSQSIGMKVP